MKEWHDMIHTGGIQVLSVDYMCIWGWLHEAFCCRCRAVLLSV